MEVETRESVWASVLVVVTVAVAGVGVMVTVVLGHFGLVLEPVLELEGELDYRCRGDVSVDSDVIWGWTGSPFR